MTNSSDAAAAGKAPASSHLSPLRPLQVAVALALLMGLQPVATDMYLPALPALRQALSADMAQVQMTMSALLLAFGFGQLAAGPLSDRFGRRPVLLSGLALFSLASLAAALAPGMNLLIGARAGQGLGLAASVVCGRAMARDLYEPHEGARIMSKGLTGLGVIAILAPTLGGLLAALAGWRAPLLLVMSVGLLVLLFVWRTIPETLRQRRLDAVQLGSLVSSFSQVAAHPSFRAWTGLITGTYAGLFVWLSTSSFVYMRGFGLAPWAYGLVMATASLSYVLGTFHCRALLARVGLRRAVRQGGWLTLIGSLGLAAIACLPEPPLIGVVLCQWIYSWGHGIHQPCGQTGAVAAFPQRAGVASALTGFVLAFCAFFIGLWLGQHMNLHLDSPLAAMAPAVAVAGIVTACVAWTLVQRHGEAFTPAAA